MTQRHKANRIATASEPVAKPASGFPPNAPTTGRMSVFSPVYVSGQQNGDPLYYPRQFEMSPEERQVLNDRIKSAVGCSRCWSMKQEILRLRTLVAERDDQIAQFVAKLKTAEQKHEEAELKPMESRRVKFWI